MGTISRYISDDRLDLIISILMKIIESFEARSSDFQDRFSESLTIAEATFIAIGLKIPPTSEEDVNAIAKGLDEYLAILEPIGVPLTIPMNKLSPAQLSAIEEGQSYIEGLAKLKSIWEVANSA